MQDGYTPLMWASMYDRLDAVKVLIELEVDLNVQNNVSATVVQI